MRTIQDRSLFVLWESTALFEQFITNERQLPRTCHTVVPKSFLQVFLHYSQWTFQNWVKVLKRIWVISCKTHPWLDTTPMWYPFSMTLRGPKSSNLAKPWGWEVTGSTSINFQKGTKNRYKNTRIHNWQWNSMVFFFRPTRQPCLFLGGAQVFVHRALKDQKTSWLQQDLHPISWWSSGNPSKAPVPTLFLRVLHLEGEGLPVPKQK